MERGRRVLSLLFGVGFGLGLMYGAFVLYSSDNAHGDEMMVEGRVVDLDQVRVRNRRSTFNYHIHTVEFTNPVTGSSDTVESSRYLSNAPEIGDSDSVFVDPTGEARVADADSGRMSLLMAILGGGMFMVGVARGLGSDRFQVLL